MVRDKKLLIIAYNFPPLISPQSLRWFYIVRELSARGYDINVLTIRMPKGFKELLDNIPEDVKVHRTFPGFFYYLTFKCSRESIRKNEREDIISVNKLFWRSLSFAHFKIYNTLNSILLPDIYSEWLPFAIKAGLKLIKINKYRVIITSSEPRVCHIVGYYLKKKSGIPWIADYGDPWVYPVPTVKESQFKKKIIEKIEKTILKEMNVITVAADGIKDLYLSKYPFLDKNKIFVIPQGYDPDMFPQYDYEKKYKFRIVYCGSFYKGLRDPMAFFEAIKEIRREDFEVIIAGRINEFAEVIKRDFKDGVVKYNGFLSHKESLSLQKNATMLLHIGNITDVQVPGKIYEYIGAGRPILCVSGNDNDLSAKLVNKYNRGIVVKNSVEDIKKGIMELYDLWKSGMLDSRFDLGTLNEFSWQQRARDISNIIKSL